MKKSKVAMLEEGDRIKIVSKKEGDCWAPHGEMDEWLGKVMTVREMRGWCLKTEEDKKENMSYGWNWYPEMIECKVTECDTTGIVLNIFVNKKKRTVVCKLSDGRIGKARCNPEDEWDEATGIKLAVDRAYGTETIVSPEEDSSTIKVGDYVRIKSKEEIEKGIADGTIKPFTIFPAMEKYCGCVCRVKRILSASVEIDAGWSFRNGSFEKYTGEVWEFTDQEKSILSVFSETYKYVARDKDGKIFLYREKPEKSSRVNEWANGASEPLCIPTKMFDVKFSSVQWSDNEPCEFRLFI